MKGFVVVSKTNGASPRPVVHSDLAVAVREAKRLAELNPEDEFTVFASFKTFRLRKFEEEDATPADLYINDVPF